MRFGAFTTGIMRTAASLSQCARIRCPCQVLPHTVAAITTANSSLNVMLRWSVLGGHWNCHHCVRSDHAPQPHVPEASEKNSSGSDCGSGKKPRPFHAVAKVRHHARSARKSLLRRINGEAADLLPFNRSIIRRMKVLPGGITLAACVLESTDQGFQFPLYAKSSCLPLAHGTS